MTGLEMAMARLSSAKRKWSEALGAAETAALAGSKAARPAGAAAPATRLRRVAGFGSNPGGLEMFVHVPARLAPAPGLVVVLHGCGQTAAGYDRGTGWSDLADRHGFVLLFPQQTKANNPKTCFNWFTREDTERDRGEALSIRQMIETAVAAHGIDRTRIFVTGLSAGGAMAAVMLATYPEVFAAGAVIAGLPYGAATNVQGALDAMFQGRVETAAAWGDRVRTASGHRGRWPKLSVWHGGTDPIVKPVNAAETIKQWTNLHGLPAEPSRREIVDGHPREVWLDRDGREAIESFSVAGMGHGTPLRAGLGEDSGGVAGPFFLDVGISSSHHIVRFFGLADWRAPQAATVVRPTRPALDGEVLPPATGQEPPRPEPGLAREPWTEGLSPDVLALIEKAFRAGGLLKS